MNRSHASCSVRTASDIARRLGSIFLWTTLALALPLVATAEEDDSEAHVAPYSEPTPENARGTCLSPQEAVYQLLYWLQPERMEPERASRCFDFSSLGADATGGPHLALQLKRVLDARALYVRWSDVPDDPDFLDPKTKQHRYVLFPTALPEVEVIEQDGRWVFSAATVQAVPDLVSATFPFEIDQVVQVLPNWMKERFVGLHLWQYVGVGLLILLGLIFHRLVIFLLNVWVRRVASRWDSDWIDRISEAASRPVAGLAMAGVFAIGIPLLQFPVSVSTAAFIATKVLSGFSIVWLGYRLVDVLTLVLERRAQRTDTKLDDQLVPLVRKALKVLLIALGSIFILQNLDVDVGSLLAGLGLGGLAFALAAKDTVANLFGSVMIFLDKPFQVGDWVKIGGDLEGTVEEVGFRSTRIRTFYSSVITVPNAKVADAAIDNLGVRKFRRYKTVLSLTYDTPPAKISAFCDGVKALIAAIPGMRKDFDLVEFSEFGASSLNVMVYCFMDTSDWSEELRVRHNLNLGILQLGADLGVNFAFPTSTVYLESVPETTPAPNPHAEGYTAQQLRAITDGYGPGGQRFTSMHQRGEVRVNSQGPRRGDSDG